MQKLQFAASSRAIAVAALSAWTLGAADAAPPAPSAAPQTHEDHAYAPPDPKSLGGPFVLRDRAGRLVTAHNLKGRWTLVYFGYSRCTDTCPVALPTIVQAAKDLAASGVPSRAVFIDIEPPDAPIRPRNPELRAAAGVGHHDSEADRTATAQIADRFGNGLLILTGSRSQLNAATAAFQVQRDHAPPRPREVGHSINHSALIYLLSPSGAVTAYFPNSVDPGDLAAAARAKASG